MSDVMTLTCTECAKGGSVEAPASGTLALPEPVSEKTASELLARHKAKVHGLTDES
jgi:hypothetical protein